MTILILSIEPANAIYLFCQSPIPDIDDQTLPQSKECSIQLNIKTKLPIHTSCENNEHRLLNEVENPYHLQLQ